MSAHRLITLTLALYASAGCQPAAEPDAQDSVIVPASEGSGEAVMLATEAQQLFGMPVPEGAELDESGESFAHYSVPGSYDEVVADYRDALTGYRAVEYDEGVKFEPRDGTGRSLYVLEGQQEGLVLVTYFNEQVAVASNAVAESPTSASRVGEVPGTPERNTNVENSNGNSRSAAVGGSESGTLGQRGTIGDNGSSAGTGPLPTIERRVQPRSNAPERGTTNPLGRRPINFTGVFESPRNPNAYY